MSKQGGEIEGGEAVSKELDDNKVLSGDEEEEEPPKDPKPEEPTVSEGESRAEPPESFSITRE